MKFHASLAVLLVCGLPAQAQGPFVALSDSGSVIRMVPSQSALKALGMQCNLFAPQHAGTAVYQPSAGIGQLINRGGFELPSVGFQAIYYNSTAANSTSTSLGYATLESELSAFISAFPDNKNWSGSPTDDYTIIQQYGSTLPIANSIVSNPSNLITPGAPFVDSQPPVTRITDSQIQTYLVDLFAVGALHASSNVVYGIYFPAGTSVIAGAALSCTNFCGYHSHFAYGTVQVIYAVFPYPSCTSCTVEGLSAADILSIVTGAQIRESVTDPGTLGLNSWQDVTGLDADQKCTWCNLYQMTNGQFWVQPEFSNGGTTSNSGFTATYPDLSSGQGGCVVPNNQLPPP